MWMFLATEVLFFGGLFTGLAVYRSSDPRMARAFAEASEHLSVWFGGINTAVLLTSSLTMALAVRAAQLGRRGATTLFLLLTIGLGVVFLGIKGTEYYIDYKEGLIPQIHFEMERWTENPRFAEMFFVFYFIMTGLHAIHMIIGIGVLAVLGHFAWRGRYQEGYHTPVELTGLYWHFVDIVWIFLFPLFYLIRH
jgi:cytochrome c oxidase subunit 3